jgi:hypothetical protein
MQVGKKPILVVWSEIRLLENVKKVMDLYPSMPDYAVSIYFGKSG